MKKKEGHEIVNVAEGSIAQELEIAPGDRLLRINDKPIRDVFDYHFAVNEEELTVLIEKPDGEQWELDIEKDYDEDLGLEFSQGLMDQYRSCTNQCMFCFIDQMPPGMRETLYFKDDDARLSFLQGNYVTLTNMKEEDVERILLYKLSPINISVHTMNPQLRCRMLHNRFAGQSLDKIKRFANAGIEMNSQIVLCKDYNDKEELDESIRKLSEYYPQMKSLSVVPVGLTKYRENLTKLEKFEKEDAVLVLKQIHAWQDQFLEKLGTRFVFASDEWYLTAGEPVPSASYYEGYGQIENGVGMIRSLWDEAEESLAAFDIPEDELSFLPFSMATGVLAAPLMEEILNKVKEKYKGVNGRVYTIINNFFGTDITVAGLLTGQDIVKQLKGKELGEFLILPEVLLRSQEEVLLDDMTVSDIERELSIKVRIAQNDGSSLIHAMLGR